MEDMAHVIVFAALDKEVFTQEDQPKHEIIAHKT